MVLSNRIQSFRNQQARRMPTPVPGRLTAAQWKDRLFVEPDLSGLPAVEEPVIQRQQRRRFHGRQRD